MNNDMMINKLNELKSGNMENALLIYKIDNLINELKQEITLKGFSTNEKERLKLALSIQNKMMRNATRPILALWNFNTKDNHYYWTNTAIMVRLSKENFFNELKTTSDNVLLLNKKDIPVYEWKANMYEYPKVDNIWLTYNSNASKTTINIKSFMLFLKANKDNEFLALKINDNLTIKFSRKQIYNALILSKVAQKDNATLYYISEFKPFQFDDNCLCTSIRGCDTEYLTFDIRG